MIKNKKAFEIDSFLKLAIWIIIFLAAGYIVLRIVKNLSGLS